MAKKRAEHAFFNEGSGTAYTRKRDSTLCLRIA